MSSNDRPIHVTAWYPTEGSPGGRVTPNAPVNTQTPAPLILYSTGWTGTRTQSSVQTENLASHGFVVVACDDYASDVVADPDRGLSFDFSSNASTAASIARGERHVATQAGILLEILDALGTDQAGPLSGRLDLSRVGVLGYSIGGAAGADAASRDARIVAVFNLDGWLFGPSAETSGREAYFLLSSYQAFPPEADSASPNPVARNIALLSAQDQARNARRTSRPGGYWIALDNADHDDLSDRLFTLSRRKLFRSGARRRDIHAAIATYEVAFFRSALLDENSPLLVEPRAQNPQVRWIRSIPAAPPGIASTNK